MSFFTKRTSEHADTDNLLLSELRYAGIPSTWDVAPERQEPLTGAVKTPILGSLYGWSFVRFPTYWEAQGPGIDVEHAEHLHARYGADVRVGGDVRCPSPMAHYKGLASGYYHVDSFEGLRALSATIKLIVEGPKPLKIFGVAIPIPGEMLQWLALM